MTKFDISKLKIYKFVVLVVVLTVLFFPAISYTATNVSGTISLNTTWPLAASPYVVTGDVTVGSGATLTIEAGTIVKFNSSKSLIINGTLTAVGTALNKIYFTSIKDDTVGGDTNGDGGATSPAAGNWNYIWFNSGSTEAGGTIDYAEVRYGGSGSWAIWCSSSTSYNNPCNPTITNTTISNSGGYAISYSNAPAFSNLGTSNTYTNNTNNAVAIAGGTISAATTWKNIGVPYVVTGDVTVGSGAGLTIEAGVVVKFNSSRTLTVNGTLTAVGTSTNKIYFTSIKDDTVGGDTNGDGATTTPAAGNWSYIFFNSGSTTATGTIDYAEIRYGGGSLAGIWCNSSSSYNNPCNPTITNTTISNSGGYAIYYGNAPSFSNLGTSNTYTNNTNNAIAINGGTISTNTTWKNLGIPYVVTSEVTVGSGATLTIEAGTIVKFSSGKGLYVNGTLSAVGTALNKIYFTSIKDDTIGGDTNGDGGATTPTQGDWSYIFFNSGSTAAGGTIDYAEVRYGGSGSWAIWCNSSTSYNNPCNPTITNTTISNSGGYAIDYGNAPSFTNLGTSNTYTNNKYNAVAINGGTISAATTWKNIGIPYVVTSDVTVGSAATLTIEAGTVVKFGSGRVLYVYGTLTAVGISTNKIYFTSIKDDTVGGDTNGDGGTTSPAAGDWSGIYLKGSSNTLTGYEIRYSSDTTAPTISLVASSSITGSSAVITWSTSNEASTTQVEYGTTTSYGSATTLDETFVLNHSANLSGLSTNTLYHYRVKSKDVAGNESVSGDYTFTTTGAADTTPPVISSVTATNITSSSATITWVTDEASDSKVDYGTTTSYGSIATNINMTTSHSINLTALSANTTYNYKVTSKDGSNNSSSSTNYQFTTLAADTTAPVISAISSGTPTYNSATITATTNESAVCNVDYGLTTSYGSSTSYETTYSTTHSITLSGLNQSSTYNYKINCKDASSNLSSSTNQTFTTTAPSDTTAPVITNVIVSNITNNSAIISWTTDESATSFVGYGKTPAYELGSISDNTLFTTHSIGLTNLTANTTYNYEVCSFDTYNNGPTCSANQTFQTTSVADTTAPAISNISSGTPTYNSATITFTTDEPSVCQTSYATSAKSAPPITFGETTFEISYVISHSIIITNLSASTTYNYTIDCKDTSNNLRSQLVGEFTTAAAADTTAPASSVLGLISTQTSATFMVYWSGSDNKSSSTNLVYDIQYKDGLTGTWTDWKTNTSLTNAEFTGENGHTYYFRSRAKDEAGNWESYVDDADTYTTIEFAETKNNPQQQEAVIWGMISLPLDPDDKTPQAVFGDNVKNEDLQLYYWNPNASDDAIWYKYVKPTSIELGQGYWLYVNNPVTVDVKGKPWKQNANYEKRVYSGWNMVGNPFLFNIDWKNIQFRYGGATKNLSEAVTAGWINNYIYSYGKNAQGKLDWSKATDVDGLLRPWVGYCIYAKVEGDLIFQPIKSLTAKFKVPYVLEEKKKEIQGLLWQMQIKAEAGSVADSDNVIGVGNDAKDTYDIFDILEPPQIRPYISVYFPHNEWGNEKGRYADDIKSKNGQEKTWDMVVETDIKNTNVVLSWEQIKGDGNPEKIALLDVTANMLVDIQNSSYSYFSGNGGARRFKIFYGNDRVEKEQQKRTGPVSLLEAYTAPNPYRGINSMGSVDGKGKVIEQPGVTFRYKLSGQVLRVQIEVYTMTGKLIDKFAGELDGETVWKFGDSLPNGVYIYRVTAYDSQGQQQSKVNKLVVIK